MTGNDRLMALARATEDQLMRIDLVLTNRDPVKNEIEENLRLLTIKDACKRSNLSYPKVYRAMNDGLLDTVNATGRRMITEASLLDFCRGVRRPSAEVLARRAARNAARREAYRLAKSRVS